MTRKDFLKFVPKALLITYLPTDFISSLDNKRLIYNDDDHDDSESWQWWVDNKTTEKTTLKYKDVDFEVQKLFNQENFVNIVVSYIHPVKGFIIGMYVPPSDVSGSFISLTLKSFRSMCDSEKLDLEWNI